MKGKKEKRLFGTNGVRGVVGKDMTPAVVLDIGAALGSMRSGTIAVGRDTRTSGIALVNAIKSGLLLAGCDAVDCGILPTPALQYLVRKYFDGGAMITASHNPPEYNGVKIIEPDGTEMGDEETVKLEERFFTRTFTLQSWDRIGRETDGETLLDEYIDAIVAHFPQNIGKGMKVVVDPGSGPASLTTPRILGRLGCTVFTINGQLDGTFPSRLPEPSAEGLSALSDLVISTGSAFGVAHDGDADRAVFVDEFGEYVEENQEFALIARIICQMRKGVIVTPVSTSHLVEQIASKHGSDVIYTPVGSIYVARTMLDLIAEGREVILGGEGNGGLIYPTHQFCRDGGMTAAIMVSVLKSSGIPLSENVKKLPSMSIIKEKIQTRRPKELLKRLEREFSDKKLDKIDGIKISNSGYWALIRPSGTEPFVRIIVESTERETAHAFYRELMKIISPYRE